MSILSLLLSVLWAVMDLSTRAGTDLRAQDVLLISQAGHVPAAAPSLNLGAFTTPKDLLIPLDVPTDGRWWSQETHG
ncbi:MAG: hypothetical protein RL318_382 [Fibrobacterota bacterium]|jgi:hypothetical protein